MHMIDTSNDRDNLAYVGQAPWHGLGQKLTENVPIEQWIIEAGFDWEVLGARAAGKLDDGSYIEFPTRRVLYRSDTKMPLAVISDRFKPVQPKQVLEFYRDLTESQGFKLETAGVLRGGKTYWALARVPMDFRLKGKDEMLAYLLLATANDGTMATYGALTAVRTVCWNTLALAYAEMEEGMAPVARVPHFVEFDANAVKAQLGLLDGTWDQFKKDATKLTQVKVSREQAVKYFVGLTYSVDEEFKPERPKPKLVQLLDIYEHGVGQDTASAHNTAWGLVNAVTHAVDHNPTARGADTRLNKAWFGKGARTKQQAFVNALALAA